MFANRIPNFLRRLFAEGAFAQAFVPVLSEIKEHHGDDKVKLFVAQAAGTLGTILLCVTIFGVIALACYCRVIWYWLVYRLVARWPQCRKVSCWQAHY
ncbi:lipid II flippase MurJ [Pseudoalteromonas sp. Hal099]